MFEWGRIGRAVLTDEISELQKGSRMKQRVVMRTGSLESATEYSCGFEVDYFLLLIFGSRLSDISLSLFFLREPAR